MWSKAFDKGGGGGLIRWGACVILDRGVGGSVGLVPNDLKVYD